MTRYRLSHALIVLLSVFPGTKLATADESKPSSVRAETESGHLYEFHHDNVVGTQLELRVLAENETSATMAEATVLGEIDRLNKILSTYQSDSELSRWLAAGETATVSDDLEHVLKASELWHQKSSGAFHPGVELISRIWRASEKSGVVPADSDLATAVAKLKTFPWTWSGAKVKPVGYALTFNALAKGYIIDKACDRAMQTAGVQFVSINIGGDLRVAGSKPQRVVVRTESSSGDDRILDTLQLQNQSMATSGPQFRGFDIGGQHYSHLIDPTTGLPVDHVRSASVVASNAMDADALATACSVMPVEKSLELIESIPDAACLLLSHDGTLHASSRWKEQRTLSPNATYQLTAADEKSEKKDDKKKAGPWNGGMEMQVDLEIIQAGSGGRYRRPYVACWVEDEKGFPVRTILLWVQSTGPGPKWIPDLRRWYKSDRVRGLAEDTNLVETVSEATRKPGKYTVVWDGTDDNGKLTPPGKYTFYIEAAREHGTYQLIKKEITIGDKAFEEKFEDNVELKNAHIEYRKAK